MNFSQEDKDRFWSKVEIKGEDECWNWTAGLNTIGYGQFYLNGKGEKAHRCALVLANAVQPLNKTLALHTCLKNRKCCNPNHLYYGDAVNNYNDQIKDGTIVRFKGEEKGTSKLTEIQVREIRQKYIPYKYTQKNLAEEYGVTQPIINRIINYEIWKHVN